MTTRVEATPEVGEVILTRFENPETGRSLLRVDRADPRALISCELLDQVQRGLMDPSHVSWNGDARTLTIHGENQTVAYRVTHERNAERNAYLMVWPD